MTYFEHLETLLTKVAPEGFVEVPLIRDAMIKDQHQLFHDAEFYDGCPICRREREEND